MTVPNDAWLRSLRCSSLLPSLLPVASVIIVDSRALIDPDSAASAVSSRTKAILRLVSQWAGPGPSPEFQLRFAAMNSPNAGPAPQSTICAVITTYRPEVAFASRVGRVRAQVATTIIVDDGAQLENVRLLHEGLGGLDNVLIHHIPSNVGVAASL